MSFIRLTAPNFKPAKPVRRTAEAKRHLARVKALPCAICKHPGPSDAHHVFHGRFGQSKASDFDTIPLCVQCHREGPMAIHNANREAYQDVQ